ncbi:MAG TPA: Gfo/Idh/MocA family oxidoreductase [Caulobacteraceae bacterium]|nr:Gfo/Idh/MocA family oxidoreductase [Caulobacteraceae bacterium]
MGGAAAKVALLGAGRMGQVHGRNAVASPRFDLAWLVEPRAELSASLCNALGCRPAGLTDVLADSDVVGVIVASSTDTHLDLVLACLRAGKAVFCEKPLDLELARLRAYADELAAPCAPLYVAFNRRFDPEFRALKRRLASGAIGALETLHLISHDPAAPPPAFIPTSGGLFRDFTIHDFDVARWLLEEPPTEVFAWAECLVDPAIAAAGDVDTARLVLRCASGRLCVISNTRRSGYGYDQRVEAYGSRGAALAGNPRISTVETWSETGALAAPIYPGFATRYVQSYRAELDHFADVLAGEAEPETGYDASMAALLLADAAFRSLREGRSVPVETA